MDKKNGNYYDYRTLRSIINANHDRFSSLNFDDSMSLLQKMNALVEYFKVLLTEYDEWIAYLDDFQENFDENLYNTVDDILEKWETNGEFRELILKVFGTDISTIYDELKKINENKADKTDLNKVSAYLNTKLENKISKNEVESITKPMLSKDLLDEIALNEINVNVNTSMIDDNAVTFNKINKKAVDIISTQSSNYDETALKKGYKRFLNLNVEKGGIISSTGNDRDYQASIRSVGKVIFGYTKLRFFISDENYRVRLFIYNSGDAFESVTNWFVNNQVVTVDLNKKYRFEINRKDDLEINLETGYFNVKVVYDDEKIDSLETLSNKINLIDRDYVSKRVSYENTALNYGFNKELNYTFESGSINVTNGNDIDSPDSIRTKNSNKLRFIDQVTVINLNSDLYKIKFIPYDDNGVILDGGFWVNAPKNGFSLDLTKQFRIQISTVDGSPINMTNALNTLKIVYSNDTFYELPLYWKNYLDGRFNGIRQYFNNGKDLVSFILVTDTHYVPNNVNDINGKIPRYVSEKLGLNTLIHLGDLFSENTSKNIALDRLNLVIGKFRNSTDNFYPIRGNHDDNNEGSLFPFSSCITQKESYSWLFRHLSDKVVMGDTGTYYYIDNEYEKTRKIFLDVIDFPYTDNGSGMIKEKYLSWGIKQMNWFANVALKTPDNYNIMIFNHTPIVDSIVTKEHGVSASKQTLPKNASHMIQILEAYVNREKKDIVIDLTDVNSFEYFNGTVSVDYQDDNSTIVGWFCGHEHIDDIQPIGNTNIKCVTTLNNSVNFSSNLISSTYQPIRKMFDTTEEVYDIVIVDKVRRIVTMERIGAGNKESRSFTF